MGPEDIVRVAIGDEEPGWGAGEGADNVNVDAVDGLADAGHVADGGVADGAEDGFEVAEVETVDGMKRW